MTDFETAANAAKLTECFWAFVALKAIVWFVWHFIIDFFVSWKSLGKLLVRSVLTIAGVTAFWFVWRWIVADADATGDYFWFNILNRTLWVVFALFIIRDSVTFGGISQNDWSIRDYRFDLIGIRDTDTWKSMWRNFWSGLGDITWGGSSKSSGNYWKKREMESFDRWYDRSW